MCDYEFCDNKATHYDEMDNKVCVECIEREVDEGTSEHEDFEAI